jgi:hypothetical protein
MIGIDRAKMRLYDLEDIAQSNLADSGQGETENTNLGMSKLLKTKD